MYLYVNRILNHDYLKANYFSVSTTDKKTLAFCYTATYAESCSQILFMYDDMVDCGGNGVYFAVNHCLHKR